MTCPIADALKSCVSVFSRSSSAVPHTLERNWSGPSPPCPPSPSPSHYPGSLAFLFLIFESSVMAVTILLPFIYSTIQTFSKYLLNVQMNLASLSCQYQRHLISHWHSKLTWIQQLSPISYKTESPEWIRSNRDGWMAPSTQWVWVWANSGR